MGEYQRVLKGVQTETARALNQFKYKPRDTQFTNLTLDELNKIRLLEDLDLRIVTGKQIGRAHV